MKKERKKKKKRTSYISNSCTSHETNDLTAVQSSRELYSSFPVSIQRYWDTHGSPAFIVRHDVLVVGRSFAPAHHHSPTPPPLLYLSFFIFFGCLHSPLGNLNEKFHNSSTRNRRNDLFTPCVRCCCSFPLCFLLLLFSFDFIISKVTALGARTTTTFYLMS